MRAFRFPFERVLHVRRLQETEARATFLAARALAESARAAAREAGAALERGQVELLELQSSSRLAPRAVIAHQAALGELARVRGLLEAEALDAERRAASERSAWESRRAGVLGLEKLETRRRTAHAAEIERLESREQDERALSQAARSQSRGTSGRLQGGPPKQRSRPEHSPADEIPGRLPGETADLSTSSSS